MSWRPAAIMMRSVSVVPSRRPCSRISSANGAFTVSQPETGPPAAVSAHRRERATPSTPAWMVTTCRALPVSLCRMTSWSPGARSADRQRRDAARRAIDRDLRAGRLRLHLQLAGRGRVGELEVLRDLRAGRRPGAESRAARRGRAARGCASRASTERRAGVMPRSMPSTNTCTPAGFDCTMSVPVVVAARAAAGTAVGR